MAETAIRRKPCADFSREEFPETDGLVLQAIHNNQLTAKIHTTSCTLGARDKLLDAARHSFIHPVLLYLASEKHCDSTETVPFRVRDGCND
jgi:hypothetical protein